jgi:GntR family transcriptional regulator
MGSLGRDTEVGGLEAAKLDRLSYVPLYYQLQEVLKQQIESGIWRPGDRLPSEPELARRFGVSRVVVRQALGILESDAQIARLKGRGTFVARPKLNYRAGGLIRLLATDVQAGELAIKVLDKRTQDVEASIREVLAPAAGGAIFRLTTLLSVRSIPLAVGYSFFSEDEMGWLKETAKVGQVLPPDLDPLEHGILLAQSQVTIELSHLPTAFDTSRLGIPRGSPVFLVLSTEHRQTNGETRPFEVTRLAYRADLLQFRLESPSQGATVIEAKWSFNDTHLTAASAHLALRR